MSSRGCASPSSSRTRPATLASPPPRSSMRRGMTSKLRRGPPGDDRPEHGRLEERAQGVDVVDEKPLQIRIDLESLCEHAVAQQVGHLVEMTGRIEPLDRQVVGVIASFALAPGPIEDRAAAGVTHLLFVVIQRLVAGLFP